MTPRNTSEALGIEGQGTEAAIELVATARGNGQAIGLVPAIAHMAAALMDTQSRFDFLAVSLTAYTRFLNLCERLDRLALLDQFKRHNRITAP